MSRSRRITKLNSILKSAVSARDRRRLGPAEENKRVRGIPPKTEEVLDRLTTLEPADMSSYINNIESIITIRGLSDPEPVRVLLEELGHPEEEWNTEDLKQLVELSKNQEYLNMLRQEQGDRELSRKQNAESEKRWREAWNRRHLDENKAILGYDPFPVPEVPRIKNPG